MCSLSEFSRNRYSLENDQNHDILSRCQTLGQSSGTTPLSCKLPRAKPNDCAVCKKKIQSVCQQMPYLLVRRSLRDGEEYEQNITRSLYKKGNKSATTYKSDCMELFSSNANLTTLFPFPSIKRRRSRALVSTPLGIPSQN